MTRYETIRIGIVAAIGLGLLHSAARGDGWEREIPQFEEAKSVQQTTDGGFIVAGSMRMDVGLVKMDTSGNPVWSKSFGGPDWDEASSVEQTGDGGFVVVGNTDVLGMGGGTNIYLVRTDASGNELWTRTFGGSDRDYGLSVQQTSDGGFIIAGSTYSFGSGGRDVYLIKTDASGNEIWSKTFGGADDDGASSVRQTTDGGFIIVGWTDSFGAGQSDVALIKTDSAGSLTWWKTYGGPEFENGRSVWQTTDGGFILAGGMNDAVYLLRTDGAGNEVWSKTFTGKGKAWGESVQQTADGGFIVVGETWFNPSGNDEQDYVYLVRVDQTGNELWSKTFSGNGAAFGSAVGQTADGGFIVAGDTRDYNHVVYSSYLIYYKRGGAEPEITAKHSGFPISVPPGTAMDVAISLAPVGQAGANGDWWVVAQTPFGWYSFDLSTWQPGIQPIYQGPLVELPDFSILDSPLPAGQYTFYFGVDTNPNGVVDLDSLTFDSVTVDVSP